MQPMVVDPTYHWWWGWGLTRHYLSKRTIVLTVTSTLVPLDKFSLSQSHSQSYTHTHTQCLLYYTVLYETSVTESVTDIHKFGTPYPPDLRHSGTTLAVAPSNSLTSSNHVSILYCKIIN